MVKYNKYETMKKCCVCEQNFPATLEYFHARSSSEDGLRCDCKSCRKHKKLKNYQKETKKCSKCNIEKPNTSDYFHIRNNGVRARSRSLCKECHCKIMRVNHLLREYDMSENDYLQMYELQKGKCLICHNKYDLLCVDHNHNNGKVRGLLCDGCNRGIGFLKEN